MGWAKRMLALDMDRRIEENKGRRGAIQGDLEKLGREWAQKTVRQLKENIKKKGLTVSRELIDSLDYELVDGTTPSILLSFSVHGRAIDMKELFWHKAPPVDKLEAWVKRRGVSYFNYVPGYKGVGDEVTGLPNAANRIAWAIARNRASGEAVNQYGRWKREKIWQNPGNNRTDPTNLGTSIGHLRHLLEEWIAQEIEIGISTSLTNT
jgi:hypothetical protein